MLVNLAAVAVCNMHIFATMLLQGESSVGWDPISLWKQMGLLAKVVVIILFIMSGWSIGVMIDRWMAFNAARNQSRSFAPAVAGANERDWLRAALKAIQRSIMTPIDQPDMMNRMMTTAFARSPICFQSEIGSQPTELSP